MRCGTLLTIWPEARKEALRAETGLTPNHTQGDVSPISGPVQQAHDMKTPNPSNLDTSTAHGFKEARQILGLNRSDCARLLETSEKTVERWENPRERPPHPMAAVAMSWFLGGFRPVEWPQPMSGQEFAQIRADLGLSVEELADLLDVEPDLISYWESGEGPVLPVGRRVMRWLEAGYRPDAWPKAEKAASDQ